MKAKCQECGFTVRKSYKQQAYYCLACDKEQTCELCGRTLEHISFMDDLQVCADCKYIGGQ
jgi:ribosomal protein L37E